MSNGGGTTSSAAACRLQSTNAKIRKESKAGVSANCELPESIIHKENENMKYDYLVVGAGLFGAAFAQMAKEKGKRVLDISVLKVSR